MWTAPWLQEFVRVNPIACDHMSGLLSRSHMTAAKMGSATRGPNNQTASFANGSHGLSRVLGSIDHTHLLEQARPPACGVSRVPNLVIRSISWRSCWAPSLSEDDSFAYADGGALGARRAGAVKADRRSPPQAAWPSRRLPGAKLSVGGTKRCGARC